MEIVELKLDELTPFENNAKIHTDKDVDVIANSIKEFGMNDPVGIWGDKNIIVEGHGRLLALKKLGYEKVPCIRLDHLTDEQRRMYTLTHNKSAELSEWDFEKLEQEMKQLEFELSNFGFDEKELQIEFDKNKETEEDDFDIEENIPEEATCKKGQLWKLGNHYLMCGDSTNKEDVEKLMQGNKADMVFTDPPYNVAYTGGMQIKDGHIESNGKKQIKNDKMDYNSFYNFLYDAYSNMKEFTKEKAALYIFYAHSQSRAFLNAFCDVGLKQRSIIIWHKTSGGFGDFMAQYMNAYEPCIYGSNGESVNWYGPTNEKTVWDMDKEKKCDLHPTMKPIPVVTRAIVNSSKESDVVLDLFGGSGSTLIGCEKMNRICYTMELDEKYCDVIIKRWETLTGLKAELL